MADPVAGGKLLASVAAPVVAGAAATEAFSDEHLRFVVTLATVVAVVVAVIAWIRTQIRDQIRDHSREDRERHRAVLAEIRHVRELLALKLDAPEFAPQVTGELELEEK